MKDVILIDAGTGNLRSVQKALENVGANVERTDNPQKVLTGKKNYSPGRWRVRRFYVRASAAWIGGGSQGDCEA